MPDEPHRKWKSVRPSDAAVDGLVIEEFLEVEPEKEETSIAEEGTPLKGKFESEASSVSVDTPEWEGEAAEVDGILDELTPVEENPERVLVVLPAASTSRLVRETLESFTNAEIVTTSNALRGFELALQRPFRVFLFGLDCGDLSGPMLYELISKAFSSEHGPRRLAPAVIFVRETDDPMLPKELANDVRVKDVMSKPIRIDRLLKAVEGSVEVLDPTTR